MLKTLHKSGLFKIVRFRSKNNNTYLNPLVIVPYLLLTVTLTR
jgi:hypothetical protein